MRLICWGCCDRADSGHATAEPLRSVMKFRRRICPPVRTTPEWLKPSTCDRAVSCHSRLPGTKVTLNLSLGPPATE
jgi:hypothetical protein